MTYEKRNPINYELKINSENRGGQRALKKKKGHQESEKIRGMSPTNANNQQSIIPVGEQMVSM